MILNKKTEKKEKEKKKEKKINKQKSTGIRKQEMRLWKRVSGAIKDQNSLFLASLSRRTELRNPDIEAAVIKATSHDPARIDYRNAQRVFAWVRVSSIYLNPTIWAISTRMSKTRDWVVAVKGLLLLHGVFCCKVPGAQRIGRLPFDLSSFKDKHSHPGKTWGYNAFVRSYYSFLDHKSAFICNQMNLTQKRKKMEDGRRNLDHDNEKETEKNVLRQELVWIQGLQEMLDMLMQIKPEQDGMAVDLILEVMDCIMIEIFDVYGRICTGIAGVLLNIYSTWIGKVEASMALGVLEKANAQGEELALFFEFCRDIGVSNAIECPKLVRISDEDIRELEEILNGVVERTKMVGCDPEEEAPLIKKESSTDMARDHKHERKDSTSSLQTVITDQWEVFEEEPMKKAIVNSGMVKNNARVNPFVDFMETPNELPDLISFI